MPITLNGVNFRNNQNAHNKEHIQLFPLTINYVEIDTQKVPRKIVDLSYDIIDMEWKRCCSHASTVAF